MRYRVCFTTIVCAHAVAVADVSGVFIVAVSTFGSGVVVVATFVVVGVVVFCFQI